jgi:hypothetical protein
MHILRLITIACFWQIFSLSPAAFAADVFGSPGLIELLPVGEVVGDGETSSTLNVLALTPEGEPMTNLKLKPSSTEGEVTEWIEIGGGVYTFGFTPNRVTSSSNARLLLKGRTPDREALNLGFDIPVSAASTGALSAVSNPAGLVLGQETDATINITVDGIEKASELDARSASGTVENVTYMGGGRFTARYTPQKVNYPHLGIITVVDKAHPTSSYAYYALPLSGRVRYPVQVRPNANVLLKVAGREFGPVQANAEGKASIDIIVPPGITKATVTSIVGESKGEEVLDLRVPETRKIDLFSPPATIPGDPQLRVPLRAVVLQANGDPDETAKVIFSATAGAVGDATHEGNGIYVANYTPPEASSVTPATIEVQIAGSTIHKASREISVTPVRATMMMLSAEPNELPSNSTALKVFIKVLDANGSGLPDKDILVSATGAKLKGIQDMKGGDYRVDFSAGNTGDVLVRASVAASPSKNPLRHVLVIPAAQRLNNDGISSVSVGILTVDEFGYPIPNVKVSLSNPVGDGSLPKELTTDQSGSAQFFYTAGQTAGIASIRAETQTHMGEAGILQIPAAIADVYLPPSGTNEYLGHQVAWSEIMGTLAVPRESSGEEVAAMAAGTDPRTDGQSDGVVASLALTVEPAMAIAGGQVKVKVKAVDSQGRGVAGEILDFLTSAGKFDTVKDLGGGDYQVTLFVSADTSGEVKIIVNATNGAMAMAKLPLTDALPEPAEEPASAWGATEEPTAAATEEPTPEPAAEKPPKKEGTSSTRPWIRGYVAGALASLRYEQVPSSSPGPLLPQTLAVGKEFGGKNAGAGGLQAGGRIWLPELRYVGVSGYARMTRYAIAAAEFNGTASDWLYDIETNINGRLPIEVGDHQVWFGAKVGFRFTDFMVFKGCLETGCEVSYEPLGLPGISLGLEAGADIGEDFFTVIGFSEGLAYMSVPYVTAFDIQFGYQITDYLFAHAGVIRQTRTLALEGKDSGLERGSLSDGQSIFNVGAGFSF